jgi:aspartate aminotransferase
MIFQIQWALKLPLLLPSPSWVSYGPQAKLLNLGLHWVNTEKSNQYKLTGEALEEYVSYHNIDQSLLILNYPNNPTGVTYTEEELQSIADVCRKMNIIVISDEIYGMLNYKENYHTISNYLPKQTIITSGLSKWCNAGGYRLGYGIFPTQLDEFKIKVISQASETYSCVAAPIQYAAVSVYQNWESVVPIIKKQRKVLNFVSSYTQENLNTLGVHCSASEGGFYTFIDFESHRKHIESLGINTSENLCQHLLDKWGVALLAGTSFGRDASELSARLAFVDFDGKSALSKIENYSDYTLFVNEVCPKIKASINQIKTFLKI